MDVKKNIFEIKESSLRWLFPKDHKEGTIIKAEITGFDVQKPKDPSGEPFPYIILNDEYKVSLYGLKTIKGYGKYIPQIGDRITICKTDDSSRFTLYPPVKIEAEECFIQN